MLLASCQSPDGIFRPEYRRQLLATLSVTIITFVHGISTGWLSPMLTKLQSPDRTPLDFSVSVEETSWIGSCVSIGALTGNLLCGALLDRVGRKAALYLLALPNLCLWPLLYFTESIEYLYAARVCGGMTGGASFYVIPIYIGEIADASIRGRLTSLLALTMSVGILVGFIVAAYLPYHIIPLLAVPLPVLYILLGTCYPETPQHLLRSGREAEAEDSLKFYRNYNATTKADIQHFAAYYGDLQAAVKKQRSQDGVASWRDFLTKRSLRAVCTGLVLMALNIFSGHFALVNYMSSIFAATKTQLHPDINTIIIGVVQIIGTYTATSLVDKYGRKILMVTSSAGMGVGMAVFGMYAFFAEETNADLTHVSWWLPLLLMAFITFIANVGIISVTTVLLVEIMPPKIRSTASSFCLAATSGFSFVMLKAFPLFLHHFGLSATMWFCASVCAFGLFYISVFLEETKGKSMDTD